MQRRNFLTLLGGAAVWPLVARAQQTTRPPTVGILAAGTPASHGKWVAALVARLRELGWIEGRNIAIEYRWAEGRDERVAELAAEFVRLNVDVIATSANLVIQTIMKATSQIPIVAAAMNDPISTGIIETMARPGGNVTGLTIQSDELVGKRFALLREIVPDLHRIAVMGYALAPGFLLEVGAAKAAARNLGMDVVVIELRQPVDIAPAIESLKGRAQALYVPITPFTTVNQIQINSLALDARLPSVHGLPEYVKSGGLMSYGPDFLDLFRHAGDFVDRILRGTKPAELPVEQPTKFNLVVSLKCARTLGLTFPVAMLATADEVIE